MTSKNFLERTNHKSRARKRPGGAASFPESSKNLEEASSLLRNSKKLVLMSSFLWNAADEAIPEARSMHVPAGTAAIELSETSQ